MYAITNFTQNKLSKTKVLLWILFIIITGCTQKEEINYNQAQKDFTVIIDSYSRLSYITNAIEKNEKRNELNQELYTLLDTLPCFIDWSGKIDKVNISNSQINSNKKVITFNLISETSQQREITFKCIYAIDEKELSNDNIYTKLRNLENGDKVYFDGIIKRDKEGVIKKIDKLGSYYFEFDFNILDLNIEPNYVDKTILSECVNIVFKSIKQLPRYVKSKDVIEMEGLGMNIVPNNETIQKKREEFVSILNENGYEKIYSNLNDIEKKYCDLFLGYIISQWEFDKF